MVSKKSDNKMEHYGRKTVAGLMMKLIKALNPQLCWGE